MCLRSDPRARYTLFFLVVVALAIGLRAPGLTRRPMHTDEAVHAVKFGMLLEDGYYRYDPIEYHGPTLNYLTLIPAWLASANRLPDVDEATLRVVAVIAGVGVALLLALLWPGLGSRAALAAAVLTAVSPAMVYYSRYYIQEMLLVFFSFAAIACGYRYARSGRPGWAAALGVFIGLMHATKETAVLSFGAMVVALGVTLVTAGERTRVSRARMRHGSIALVTAAAVSMLLFSSFFSNPGGVVDSYMTYANYVGRATEHAWHIQPWYYYVHMLAFFKGPSGRVWSEVAILVLAGVGVGAAVAGRDVAGVDRDLLRFLAVYASVLLAAYSMIPYKTPWTMLGALHGLILLAGVGAVAALDATPGRRARPVLLGLLLLAAGHLTVQAYRATHAYRADPDNPYVYAHPTDDVFRVAERLQQLAAVHPEGNDMHIEVISPGSDYWPLPWYLRAFPNTGWWDHVDADTRAAPVIIASPVVEEALLQKLYELPPPGERYLYVPLFDDYTEIRPTVEIRGYVRKDLWDALQQQRERLPAAAEAAGAR